MTTKGKRGRPPKFQDPLLFSLRLPAELHRTLKVFAAAQGKSLNDTLVELLQEAWSRVPQREIYARAAREAADK